MASSATPSRSGKSSRSGILNGTPASLIFALARLRRWPIAAGDTRKAEAIAAASRPRSAGTGPFDDEPHPRLPRQRPLPPRQSRPGLDAAARAADRPALRAVILPASQPDRTAVESDARERHPQQMLRQIPRLCRSRARLPAQNRATAVRRVLVDHHRQFPRHQPEGISDPRVTPLYASAVTGLEARYSVDLPTRIVRATAQGDAALSMGAGVHDQPVRSALTAVYEGLRRSHVDRRGVRSGFCHRFAVAFRIRSDRSPFLKDFQPWPNNSLSRSPKPAPTR